MTYDTFPRSLQDDERTLIRWLLPEDRPGYAAVRSRIETMQVIGAGRWGPGDLILGTPGDLPDLSGPMERVLALGVIEYDDRRQTVTVHEEAGGQIEVQIAIHGGETIPVDAVERRRYSYSRWCPGEPSPAAGGDIRCIRFEAEPGPQVFTLAIAPADERIWLHEHASGVNHLIPVTNFHNELMRRAGIRDASRVLRPKSVFTEHRSLSDDDIVHAFIRYNQTWKKTTISGIASVPLTRKDSWIRRLLHR